ncbi:cystathionine gamma-synthase 1, chloroplastic-like [Oryza brachyantha]|uniref:cystathionine gamma-synthase 1, chloroplastic-like n=1 Tax=Oryza brachyantha TaxID=4533 RepID=UPI000776437D|nr:cystathionine gamma-synthase 1, chloroplastic-like [Oryza brachyantha]
MTHWFRDSADLVAFREGRRQSFEYGWYGNPTVNVLEEKISALERTKALESILDQGNVTMFYADSLTKPHLKVVDVRRVAELCHQCGELVCIDSTLASPINQKPLTLGADVVLHSATKYIASHQDVIVGCVSGSEVLISRIRVWYHDLGAPSIRTATSI